MTKYRVLIVLFTVLLLGFNVSISAANSSMYIDSQQNPITDRQFKVKVGDVAPDFEMAMPDGSVVKLSDLRGKVVMLQFTASWCGVCRKEMPYIENDIWQKHKDNPNFALFGVDRGEPIDKIEFLKEVTGVTYPIGMDIDASIFCKFAECNSGITRNVIIDRDGKIVMLTRLFEEEEFSKMVSVIDELLIND